MQQFGRYTIEREIGRGEMGIVYLAVDPVLERRVALKTVRIPDGLDEAEKAEYLKRFYREAQAAGKLSHPGIVTIYDAGMDETTRSHFMAMEYIAGVTLKEFLAGGPRLAPPQAAFIAAGVAEALDYAHAHGVVHRDIKPANIILTDRGAIKIADFGIAKIPSSHLTMEGTYLGTPAYTSPEQVLGRPVNGRSDLFSLGIVLYELVAGKKPFPAENLGQLFHAIAFEPHPPLAEVMPGCPPELADVVDKALNKDAEVRYASGADMARDLRSFLGPGTETVHDLAGPVEPAAVAVFKEIAAPAENPLADLIAYLEETTRRISHQEEAVETQTTPTGSPALSPPRPGPRDRARRALAARRATAWLARGLSTQVFWTLAGGAALAALFIMGSLRSQAEKQFPPEASPPTSAPVASWRAEMRTGLKELNAGKVEEALARLQGVRLQRPGSPALSQAIQGAMARLRESLKAEMEPPEQSQRLLDLGQEATKRGDNFSAGEFIQAAREVEPTNPAAVAAQQDFEKRIQAAPGAAAASTVPSVRLVFESPAPRGYLTVNVDGTQVLRKEFAFNGSGEAQRDIYGRLEEPLAVTGGKHQIQVWITVKKENRTYYGSITGEFKPGGSQTLAIRLDEAAKKLVLSLGT